MLSIYLFLSLFIIIFINFFKLAILTKGDLAI